MFLERKSRVSRVSRVYEVLLQNKRKKAKFIKILNFHGVFGEIWHDLWRFIKTGLTPLTPLTQ